MMKKTVALLAVAGLAAATSDFQDDYLALRLTNATRHANSTRVNTTTPIKPVRPIRPTPVRPMIPKDRLTISTKNLTKEEREILNRLYKKQTEKTQQQTRRPVPSVRPKPHTNATNSTKPVHPKKIQAQRLDDDEFYAEDDEFFAEDDEFYAEDDEFFAEDDEFYAEDDFFYAEDDEYFAKNVTVKPHVKPTHKTNSTMIPRPRPGMIPRPKVNSTMIPRPRPGMIPRPKVNSTAIPRPRPGTLINKPRVNATKPVQTKPTRLPIKPARNATKVLAHDDDEFFAEDDEFFADEDEFWVDIDDEFFAEDDEFYAEDDEFYAEDDEFFAEDDEFYAEDDEFFAEDDEFWAPRNATRPVGRPSPFSHRNNTIHRPTGLFRPKTNSTMIPRNKPTTLFHRRNATEIRPRPHPVDRTFRPRPNRNTTTGPKRPTFDQRPVRLPIKAERNATKVLARDDDEFFADEDEFWVDIDDEFFAEDDEFYAEDDEFYAEDDEFYAEDDEYFVDADDDFFAARLHNRTHTAKPARNSTLGRLDSLLKEGKKNATIKGKELHKNHTKPAAPKKGFLSFF